MPRRPQPPVKLLRCGCSDISSSSIVDRPGWRAGRREFSSRTYAILCSMTMVDDRSLESLWGVSDQRYHNAVLSIMVPLVAFTRNQYTGLWGTIRRTTEASQALGSHG